MSRISGKSLQLFVAGALALAGFRAILWSPYYCHLAFYNSMFVWKFIGSLFSALALPIGIAMLAGGVRATQVGQMYLVFISVCSIGMACIYIFAACEFGFSQYLPRATWANVSDLSTPLILLSLLFWSRSNKCRNDREEGGR